MGFQISLNHTQPKLLVINTSSIPNALITSKNTTNNFSQTILKLQDNPQMNDLPKEIKAQLINHRSTSQIDSATSPKSLQTPKKEIGEQNSSSVQNHIKNVTPNEKHTTSSVPIELPIHGEGSDLKEKEFPHSLKSHEKKTSIQSTSSAKKIAHTQKIESIENKFAVVLINNKPTTVPMADITDPKERENLINNKQFGKIVNNKFVYPPGCPYANPGGKTVIDGKEYENQEMTQEEVDEFKQQITEHFAKLDAGEIKDEKEEKGSGAKLQQELLAQRQVRSENAKATPEGTESVTKKEHSSDSSAVLDAIRDSVDESNYEKRKEVELEKMEKIHMKLLDKERLRDLQEVPPIGRRTYQNLSQPRDNQM